jgi:hypothetical protein
MRPGSLLLLALVTLAVASRAGAAETASASGAAALEARIRARLDAVARGDAAAWATFVVDDCICGLETKSAIRKAITTRPPGVKNWYGDLVDLRVRLLGETAVARYRVAEHSEVGGKRTSIETWRTETYVLRAKEWLLVAGADTPIPPEPTAVQVDPSILKDYVGSYQYTPGSVDIVTREGDRLFVQPSGEPRVELLPETASTYFAKGEPWRLVFVRGPDGAVTSLIFRQQGQEWTATRIP